MKKEKGTFIDEIKSIANEHYISMQKVIELGDGNVKIISNSLNIIELKHLIKVCEKHKKLFAITGEYSTDIKFWTFDSK